MEFSLKSLFKKAPQTVAVAKEIVGIDIGSSSIKVVQLSQQEDYIALKTYGELLLGPYVDKPLGESVTLTQEQRIEALVDVIRESEVKATGGVLALPLSSSFMTVMTLPLKKDEELAGRIRVEARKFIPVPLKDVSLEWSELQPLKDSKEESNEHEVLIAAVQNEAYADMNKLLSTVNLTSEPTEIEVFCSQRAVTEEGDETVAIIDLGAQFSKLYIAHEGMIRKLHRVFTGGSRVTKQLATKLNLPYSEAEQLKRTVTADDEQAGLVKEYMTGVLSRPLQEFKRVIDQFEEESGLSIDRIVLCGGGASYYGISPLTQYVLDRDVVITTPFENVARPAFLEDTLNEIGPTFAVALGAALRKFSSES